MSTEEDNTLVMKMIEDFRAGGAEKLRARFVAHRLSFDESLDCLKRKRNDTNDSVTDNPAKYEKREQLDSTTPATPESTYSRLSTSGGRRSEKGGSPVTPVSPWEVQTTKRQLADANIRITDLETKISKLHSLRQEMELMYEKDRVDFRRQLETEKSKNRELEDHLSALRKREAAVREELSGCKSELRSQKQKLEEQVLLLEKDNENLKGDLRELECKKRQEDMAATLRYDQLKAEATQTEQQLKIISDRNKELEHKLQDYIPKVAKVEELELLLQTARSKVADLESERELRKIDSEYVTSQKQKLLKFPDMERELQDLRKRYEGLKDAIPQSLFLEEKVDDLKTKLAIAEKRADELSWTHGQLIILQGVLEEWHKMAREYCDIPSSQSPDPSIFRHKLRDLHQKLVILTSETGESKSILNEMQHRNNLLTAELQGVKKEKEKLKVLVEQTNSKVKVLQKKVHLVQMERDCYRTQLDSYERELTISIPVGSQQPYSQQLQQRIDTLEKIVEGYRQMNEKLENDSEKTRGISDNLALIERVGKLECERNTLKKELEELRKHKDDLLKELEYRVLKGDLNPTTSKVLHFRLNPAAEAEEKYEDEFEKLKAECSRLRERIKLLEEGNTHDLTQKVDERMASEGNSQQVQELQEMLKSQEIKMQRIKEVYLSSAKEYREVCYELFGYKMDRTHNNVYTLSNMYADSPDDHLMFKRMPDGTIDMMETPYSTTLGDLIDLHLHQHRSLPLFLGAITVDLFNKQTMITASQMS